MLRRTEYDGPELERLIRTHSLEIVYTVVTDTGSQLGALIAIQHVLEHGVEVMAIPHLTPEEIRREQPWHAVTALAELVTAAGVVPRGSYGVPYPGRDCPDGVPT
ncbi:hypothetical protein [Nocardia flavorosea]|uniref:Uncharacterized protein n=1 Tax=Nocardia flavorosea TaxID=53429 RepID=A0A846YLF8_9NOCA|nr:hypothetical protein [Nocardia flavorosea]NKY58440.1 hypothetical protein [Nocardia flavorosea]